MAKAYEIKNTSIKYYPLTAVQELKFVGFTVFGLKEGFGREYEKIFKFSAAGNPGRPDGLGEGDEGENVNFLGGKFFRGW